MGFIWSHEWDDNRGAGVGGVLIQQDGSVNIVAFRCDQGSMLKRLTVKSSQKSWECDLRMSFLETGRRLPAPDVTGWFLQSDDECLCHEKSGKKGQREASRIGHNGCRRHREGGPSGFSGRKPEDLDVKESVIFVKSDPSVRKTVAEVVKDMAGSMNWGLDYAAIQGTTHAPVFAWEYHRQGRYGTEPGRHRLCRQAHFCEIEVDTETGGIEVKKVVNVNDVGKALSRKP